MSIKYYATEQYVDEAIANLDLSADIMGSIDILNNTEPNKQLMTDEAGTISWEDKPLHKSNRTVIKFHTDDCTDAGAGAANGRFSLKVPFTQLGHDTGGEWAPANWPWTFGLDGETFTIAGRRLPVILSSPTSNLIQAHLYQYGSDIVFEGRFDEVGEHTFIFEAGKIKYTEIEYGHMPEGYPKILTRNINGELRTSYTGSTSDGGATYYASNSKFKVEDGKSYNFYFSESSFDTDTYVVTAVKNENGQIVIGNTSATFEDFPFYLIQDTGATTATLYWDGVYGSTIYFSKNEIIEEIIPLDEKFLPEHQHTTSWNELEDKPFGVKTELIEAIPEQEYTFNSIGGGIYFRQVGPYPMLDYNKQNYVVMMNNERYDCVPRAGYTDDSGTLRCLLGNATFDSDIENAQDTGEPFFIYSDPSGYTNILVNAKGPHRVGVYEEQEVIIPLDEKFIPDTVARKADIEEAITAHNYIIDDITDLQTTLNSKALQSDLELLANDLSTKADREHNHNDVYYTEAEIDTLLSEMASIERGGTGQTSIVDTTYVEPRYRASALVATETTPTENGVITWVYE